jgi:uncharacterized protein (DUF983 family)
MRSMLASAAAVRAAVRASCSGFLTLRPRCEVCKLDYGFADSGDGPAVFIVAAFIVVGSARFGHGAA